MTIEAMKQALAVLEEIADEVFSPYDNKLGDAILALRAAIEQAEKQEPVAWMYHGIRHDDTPHERPSLIWKPEYMDAMSAEKGVKATPLYTAPRQWQGLTDEDLDIRALWDVLAGMKNADGSIVVQFARAIEAKLKEKNT